MGSLNENLLLKVTVASGAPSLAFVRVAYLLQGEYTT